MKTAQHTLGPWKVRKSLNPNNTACYSVEMREDGWKEILCSHVGGCLDHPGGKRFQGSREANATLIAAAPELLECLEQLLAYKIPDTARTYIEAAIAKAKGEV